MKKARIISLVLASVMAFGFIGCNEKKETNSIGSNPKDAVIKASYTEVTADNQKQVVSYLSDNVSAENIVGDTTQADWKQGLSYKAGFSLNAKNGDEYVKASADIDLALYVSKKNVTPDTTTDLANFDVKASGNLTLKTDVKEKDYFEENAFETSKTSIKANAYITDLMAYLDYTAEENSDGETTTESEAIKTSLQELSEMLSELFGNFTGNDNFIPARYTADATTPPTTPAIPDFGAIDENTDIVALLAQYGIKLYYNLSEKDGIILKISITDETIATLFALFEVEEDTLKFNKLTADFYLAINASGMLTKSTIDVNLDIDVKIPEDDVNANFKARLYQILEINDKVPVKIPDGLATDEKYIDYNNL